MYQLEKRVQSTPERDGSSRPMSSARDFRRACPGSESTTQWLPALVKKTYDSSSPLGLSRSEATTHLAEGTQCVLENSEDWHEVREEVFLASRNMIIGCAAKKGWLLSRIGILSNHIQILVGIGVNESPESAALALLNNLAFAQGWKPVFRFSYYASTFGAYDRNASRRVVNES
jgi:hypothetical protein